MSSYFEEKENELRRRSSKLSLHVIKVNGKHDLLCSAQEAYCLHCFRDHCTRSFSEVEIMLICAIEKSALRLDTFKPPKFHT
jgi:hypothetical protein